MSFSQSLLGVPAAAAKWMPRIYTVSVNPPAIPANSTIEHVVAASRTFDLDRDDLVVVNKRSYHAGVFVGGARVNNNGRVVLLFVNTTASIVNLPAEKYFIVAFKGNDDGV